MVDATAILELVYATKDGQEEIAPISIAPKLTNARDMVRVLDLISAVAELDGRSDNTCMYYSKPHTSHICAVTSNRVVPALPHIVDYIQHVTHAADKQDVDGVMKSSNAFRDWELGPTNTSARHGSTTLVIPHRQLIPARRELR